MKNDLAEASKEGLGGVVDPGDVGTDQCGQCEGDAGYQSQVRQTIFENTVQKLTEVVGVIGGTSCTDFCCYSHKEKGSWQDHGTILQFHDGYSHCQTVVLADGDQRRRQRLLCIED